MKFNLKDVDVQSVVSIAEEAGRKILEIYTTADFTKIVDYKSDNSPLTLADKESNLIIEKGLRKLNEIPILSEEGKEISYEERKKWEFFWIVDPLDGTKEFLKKNDQFTVNIALIHKHKPVLGVVNAPAYKKLYFAKKDEGAFMKAEGKITRLTTQKKSKDWIAVGSSSHSSSEEQDLIKKYPVSKSVAIGSSLKFCLLAEGLADIYCRFGPTMEWDTAAGQVVLECSGGKVLDENNEEFSYNKASLLNGRFLCLAHKDY